MFTLAADIVLKAGVELDRVHPELLRRVSAAHAELKARGIRLRITAGTNGRHRTGSSHYAGRAVDITPAAVSKGWDPVYRGRIIAALRAQGLSVLDEYASPSRQSTGGHLHVSYKGA